MPSGPRVSRARRCATVPTAVFGRSCGRCERGEWRPATDQSRADQHRIVAAVQRSANYVARFVNTIDYRPQNPHVMYRRDAHCRQQLPAGVQQA